MPTRFLPCPAPLAALACGLALLLLTLLTGGLSPSLINPDEGAHYVNALFLGDWVRSGFTAPMAFAQDYYAQFPRVSIGHWPPAWYMLQAPLFALLRPEPVAALALSAFVAGLPAGAIVWAMQRIGRTRLGLALAAAYLLLPLVFDAARYLLLDQPLTLAVALAAVAWAHASDRPGWLRLIGFALLAAACPLIKGNGALIALVPALDIALTGRWRLLRVPALWAAAALAALLVLPWYLISFRISAGGFNYAPGLDYALLALGANLQAIHASLGAGGIALALVGVVAALRTASLAEARIGRLALAVVLATLILQSAIPAAIEPRYVAPLMPWLVVLAGLGIVTLWRAGTAPRSAAAALAVLALVPAATALWQVAPKPDLGAPAIAATLVREGGIWMVDGRAGGEGAIIAAAAHAHGGIGHRRLWVTRASQWLSQSDFMGRDYRLLLPDAAGARDRLDALGVRGIVSIEERGDRAYPHSAQLQQAVGSGFAIERRAFAAGSGSVLVARRIAPVTPDLAMLRERALGATAARLGR